jgi:hypothetical protein
MRTINKTIFAISEENRYSIFLFTGQNWQELADFSNDWSLKELEQYISWWVHAGQQEAPEVLPRRQNADVCSRMLTYAHVC